MLIDKRDSETKRCKEILLCNLKKKVNWGDFATELDCFPLFTAVMTFTGGVSVFSYERDNKHDLVVM